MDRQVCDTDYDNVWVNMIWIPLMNLIFSAISMISIIKYFFDITRQFNLLKRQYRDKQATLETTKQGAEKMGVRTLSQSLKMKYSDLKKQNSQFLAKFAED